MVRNYEPIWKIIDQRWNNQLHRPLHATAYYLNPQLHYEPNFRNNDAEVKEGLYICLRRLVNDVVERTKMNLQLTDFHYSRGTFSVDNAKACMKVMFLGEWWEMFGDINVDLARGTSLNDSILDAIDFDNIVFDDDVDGDEDDDEDGDEDDDGDLGDNFLR